MAETLGEINHGLSPQDRGGAVLEILIAGGAVGGYGDDSKKFETERKSIQTQIDAVGREGGFEVTPIAPKS
jgi:hypothetical protein